jgi:predicted nucleic acid-binding protein
VTVADASAVLEMLLRTPLGGSCAERLLGPGEVLGAPHLLDVEVAQVLRRFAAAGNLNEERGREALHDLADLPLIRYAHEPFLQRIWQLRDSLSAYDAAYVALAEALDAPLVTCDGRLKRARGHGARIDLIAEAESSTEGGSETARR